MFTVLLIPRPVIILLKCKDHKSQKQMFDDKKSKILFNITKNVPTRRIILLVLLPFFICVFFRQQKYALKQALFIFCEQMFNC